MLQQLTPSIILIFIGSYFLILLIISFLTGRTSSSNADFFLAGRNSPWYLVAFGMIGATISGVTFISVPGAVGGGGANQAFSYMQMALGYLAGYIFIALVLLPLYYRLNLTSIYGYLEQRFGVVSYKTGAAFFLVSRLLGTGIRFFLVAVVMQKFIMDHYGIPLEVTASLTLAMIWLYTYRGGVKTIVYTDTFQTLALVSSVVLTVISIAQTLEMDFPSLLKMIRQSQYGRMFYFDRGWSDPNNFFKQFIGGALITITMTGLDQDMMQKNLSCRSLREAQKNMFSFSVLIFVVIFFFVSLGAMLYLYAASVGITLPDKPDMVFPTIVFQAMSPLVGIVFILGLTASAYASGDSALAALTTSFCVDFLNFEKPQNKEKDLRRTRTLVHLGFSGLILLLIILFNVINRDSVINELFRIAGYTYGPLLGLFAFGLSTKRIVRDKFVIWVCLLAPLLSYILDVNAAKWFWGFNFQFLIIALNGLLTFAGLWLISQPYEPEPESTYE